MGKARKGDAPEALRTAEDVADTMMSASSIEPLRHREVIVVDGGIFQLDLIRPASEPTARIEEL